MVPVVAGTAVVPVVAVVSVAAVVPMMAVVPMVAVVPVATVVPVAAGKAGTAELQAVTSLWERTGGPTAQMVLGGRCLQRSSSDSSLGCVLIQYDGCPY